MDGNFNLAGIKEVVDGNDNWGGNGIIWLFAFLLLANGGFGWNNRNNANCATTEDLAQGFNFNGLQNKTNEILAAVNGEGRKTDDAICQLGYQALDNFRQLGNVVQQGFNETQRQNQQCCCDIERNLDAVNYNGAMNTSKIQQTVTEQTQKILDTLCGNHMADMQNQINQLQLQSALCGVVRYPNQTTFTAGCNPYFGGYGNNCCCNNI